MKSYIFPIVLLLFCFLSIDGFAQTAKEIKKQARALEKENQEIDPLGPTRAAFYTAVVPGLGQIYNKKYWKLPLVYAGIGVPAYFWADNNSNYNKYRSEYKKRLQGVHNQDDPIFGELDNQRIADGQDFYRRNRDLSVVITVGFYILSIVDANVDAHLMQFNVNENLSIKPVLDITNPMQWNPTLNLNNQLQYAVNIQYNF